MEHQNIQKIEPAQTLSEMVKVAHAGSEIVLDNLLDCCSNVLELGEAVLLAYKKNIKIKSTYPSWFNMNAVHENPMITVVRMFQLQCEMDKKK